MLSSGVGYKMLYLFIKRKPAKNWIIYNYYNKGYECIYRCHEEHG